ncbi:unnamed protein product [Ranitomeya imitator]|uniref:Helix-turn-helix domain-containing protein n=1 Tax=Ranitomeya imitator TaxID=111125 RepID=A0ABN9KQ77_9NEOB|nr:unnamed protein product [Ranitomeya imitator]
MAHFEESVIYKHPLFVMNVLQWTRYIDDVFCMWGDTLESLNLFFTIFNDSWPGIKVTMNIDGHSVTFLDTIVIKDSEGHLTTDLHLKLTDRNRILDYQSFHPPSVKRSIPRSQFQRVNQIVSDDARQSQRLQDMTSKFRNRGYPACYSPHLNLPHIKFLEKIGYFEFQKV